MYTVNMVARLEKPSSEPGAGRKHWESADQRIREMLFDKIEESLRGIQQVTEASYISQEQAKVEIARLSGIKNQAEKAAKHLKTRLKS